jgi:NAD(P)-dependent dehydrogenase (short-subunit alcohol dehydrogenase family)
MAWTRAGNLDGKVAIVTGAGRGLGRAMTLGLLDAGAQVAAVEHDAPVIEETQDAVEDRGAGAGQKLAYVYFEEEPERLSGLIFDRQLNSPPLQKV